MPVCRGLFCYYLFFCFCEEIVLFTVPFFWSVFFFFFLVSPGSVFVIQVVFVMLEMVRNTDIVVTTVKGFM